MRSLKEWYRFLRGDADLQSLMKKGMRVGSNFSLQPHCHIDPSHCWLVTIGDNVTFAPHVVVLAHDASTKSSCGYTKIGIVRIGNNVFVGAGSIILPGVTIGNNVIVGAGSVVSRDIPDNFVAVGSPAKPVTDRNSFDVKYRDAADKVSRFDSRWTIAGGITDDMKEEMISMLGAEGIGFIE